MANNIKKLAGQTIWYGVPTIVHRFLGFILQIFLTSVFETPEYGVMTQIYAAIPFLNVLFTYGLETSYFRFSLDVEKRHLYNTLCVSMLVTTCTFTAILMAGAPFFATALSVPGHETLIRLTAGVVFFDTLTTLPFALLRQEGRPRKYAAVKILTILSQIVLTLFFVLGGPKLKEAGLASWYNPKDGVAYIVLANMLASALSLVFLFKEIRSFRWEFDKALWKRVMEYSLPLIIVGFMGMINEMLSRLIFPFVYPHSHEESLSQLGIFGACIRLAVPINIMINIFRMGAEPFFFKESRSDNPQQTYATVMKFFVIVMGAAFLGLALFPDIWVSLITQKYKEYGEGIGIVPILAMGMVFLGIYYNLTIWYKLTNRNNMAAYVTMAGAVLTIALNILWIPANGYWGAAWANLCCYAFMMIVSYLLGQKYYPVPYNVPRILGYLGLAVAIYLGHHWLRSLHPGLWPVLLASGAGLCLYLGVTLYLERAELARVISRKPR
ncbi:lipopolysaccharide biosynthesis protein [Chitinophaga lutea]